MSERNETFPQFEDHAMPCEGCGTLVRIASSDPEATVANWAEDVVRVWCRECFPVNP